jgi:hypothetical protein
MVLASFVISFFAMGCSHQGIVRDNGVDKPMAAKTVEPGARPPWSPNEPVPAESPFDGSTVDLRKEMIAGWLLTGDKHLSRDPYPER